PVATDAAVAAPLKSSHTSASVVPFGGERLCSICDAMAAMLTASGTSEVSSGDFKFWSSVRTPATHWNSWSRLACSSSYSSSEHEHALPGYVYPFSFVKSEPPKSSLLFG